MIFPINYLADHPLVKAETPEEGPARGYFKIPNPHAGEFVFLCVATRNEAWEHVAAALSPMRRCPTWEEMCFIKS